MILFKIYVLLNLIKIAIAKNISKIPITISAILIRFVIVEVFELETLETLLTLEDEVDVDDSYVDVLVLVEVVLFAETVFRFDVEVFSVKFKSIP